jgi:hypothetical protein
MFPTTETGSHKSNDLPDLTHILAMDMHKLAKVVVVIIRTTAHLSRSKITLLITSTSEGAKTLINVEAGNLSSVVITNLTYSDMVLMLASLLHYSRHKACPKRWSAKLL